MVPDALFVGVAVEVSNNMHYGCGQRAQRRTTGSESDYITLSDRMDRINESILTAAAPSAA
ncbi:MAG: hypothetical protein IIB41_06720 [Candidatus Marinimicrobia bacterium]|nr:hypothetical protein [Candidatus Neomarinimicrobiota bacterium]